MRPKLLSQLILFLILLIAAAPAEARRVALIIGNDNYSSLSKLENPVPDAKAIAAALKAHGFEVFEHYDITRADLLDALETFKQAADQSSVALIYYAGHGMELAGKNVIAPTDMEVNCDSQQALRSVEADKLFEALGSAPQQIVLLDACRNNPFPQCPKRSAVSGNGFRGFSRLTTPDKSLLIANATLSGQLAADGTPGNHSPFAKALLARFEANPKAFMRDLLDDTARDVQEASGGGQVPEITTRGGAPSICLDEAGCGGGPGPGPAAQVTEAMIADARALLSERGYSVGSGSIGDPKFVDAIRQFEAKVGLTQDGLVSPTLLAVLHATRTAKLDDTKGGGKVIPHGALEHQIGETFRDCENCPDMVVIQPGSFLMGAAANDPAHKPEELPQHQVQIGKTLAVSKYDITFDDWDACVPEGGCNGYMPKDGGWGRGKRPAINVSWTDAKAYVDWLRQKTGKPYRLLTEAEWEYAARSGTTSPYSTGATITAAQANYDDNASGRKGKTVEVGSFAANSFGLFDMAGNVWEWVEDCWNPNHAGAPSDGSFRSGDCARRVVKGGAWYLEAAYLRPAARQSFPSDKRLNAIGFRVARELE